MGTQKEGQRAKEGIKRSGAGCTCTRHSRLFFDFRFNDEENYSKKGKKKQEKGVCVCMRVGYIGI